MRRAIHANLSMPCAAVLALLLGACAAPDGAPPAEQATEVAPVWPAPPAEPRIRYVGSIRSPRDIGAGKRGMDAFFEFLKGDEMPEIAQPQGLAFDREGRLYVVDTAARRVHVFDRKNGRYESFPEDPSLLESPIDIAIADDGRAFVSDSAAGVVRVFTPPDWKHVRDFGEGQLERPTGLALDRRTGDLLVVDTLNERLAVYNTETLALKRVIGGPGTDADSFHYPTHLTVDASGRVLVTDSLNFRIQVLTPDFRFGSTFGSAGDGPGHFSRPKGVATDSDGNVYVVDALFDNVQIFDRDGRLLLAFGSPGSGAGQFWLPTGIAIDANDRIYVADTYNRRVQVFERVGGTKKQ